MIQDILFIIYTCKKKLQLSEELYYMVNNKINCKVYLIYGDNTINEDYKIINDKYIILNTSDYYEDLNNKTIKLFNTIEKVFPNIKGCFKCDDDIIPSIDSLNFYIDYFLQNNIEYAGVKVSINEISLGLPNQINIHNVELKNKEIMFYPCQYATGPLYYLNNKAIQLFNKSDKSKFIFNEDNLVGHHLNLYNIYPFSCYLYTDVFNTYKLNSISYQNTNNSALKIYARIHGGLGNQLFQISSAYGIARKYNRILIIVTDNKSSSFNHNSHLNIYLDNIFKNNFLIINEDILDKSIITYSELGNITDCFTYNDKIIECANKNGIEQNIYLNGYFQNEKYFKDYKHEICNLFRNDKILSELAKKYIHSQNSFFIHVRRGDYVNNQLYNNINLYDYLYNCIKYISTKMLLCLIHFYVVSDDIDFCKQFSMLNHHEITRTFVEEDSLNSFYLMTLCKLGGICSNSTFSWWASYLNQNNNKMVFFPKKWINNGRYGNENDIYYENSILMDC
jgi:hypothetical protein